MTIIESLKTISSYPVPQLTLIRVAVERGLPGEETITPEILKSNGYQLAKADLMDWLSNAPNVSEGGVSFSLSQKERDNFKRKSESIYREAGESTSSVKYGYIGEEL